MNRAEAEAHLEGARNDPYGWTWLELDGLLEAWDFAYEDTQEAQGWTVRYRYRVDYPNLNMIVSPYANVSSGTVLYAVRLIDRLKEKLGPEDDDDGSQSSPIPQSQTPSNK